MKQTMGSAGVATDLSDLPGYLAYYGLHSAPFRTPTDGRHVWLGKARRGILATLTAAIRQGDGIVLLTGEAGTGKTLLVNWLIETLAGESVIVGRLSRSVYEVPELCQAVGDAFGLRERFPSAASFASRFREFLATTHSADKKVLLVIDDAQGLGDDLLRKVFDLSTVGMFEDLPLAILLSGQAEIGAALEKDQHAGLRQRVTTRCTLDPLTIDEVREYMGFRLRAAGCEEAIFDPDAVRQITAISRGAPGMIDVVSARALITGHRRKARVISSEIVEASLGEVAPREDEVRPVDGDMAWKSETVRSVIMPPRRSARGGRAVGLVLLGAVIFGAGGYALYAGRVGQIRGGLAPPASTAPALPKHTDEDAPQPPAISGDAKDDGRNKSEPPTPIPAGDVPKLSPPRRPERVRSTPVQATMPAPVRDSKPEEMPRRERIPVRAPVRETSDAHDPGAVIDWLMRESGRR